MQGGEQTGEDEGTSLKQSTLLHCFSPPLFKAAVHVDGQNLVDVTTMILRPQLLGFYFCSQQEEMAKV